MNRIKRGRVLAISNKWGWAWVASCVALFLVAGSLYAAPIGADKACQAASAYVARNDASMGVAKTWQLSTPRISISGVSREIVAKTGRVGFEVALLPSGFILVRADDDLPPVKLQVENGSYTNLPAGFRAVMEAELAGELNDLAKLRQIGTAPTPQFHAAWQALASGLENEPSARLRREHTRG